MGSNHLTLEARPAIVQQAVAAIASGRRAAAVAAPCSTRSLAWLGTSVPGVIRDCADRCAQKVLEQHRRARSALKGWDFADG